MSALKVFLVNASKLNTVDELVSLVQDTLGPVLFARVCWGLTGVAAVCAIFVLRSLYLVFWTPSVKSARVPKAAPRPTQQVTKAPPPPAPAADAVDTKKPAVAPRTEALPLATPIYRSRPVNSAAPCSTIRGFPRVGVLAVSPCQRYFIVSCRKSLKAYLYPQNSKRQFMQKGKELQSNYFTNIGPIITGSEESCKVDVSSLCFANDGSHFALGESSTDTIYICSTNGKTVAVVWKYKLPKHRLASQLQAYRWTLASTLDNCDTLVMVHSDKDAEIEVVHKQSKAVNQHLGLQKFKIGQACAWGFSGCDVAVGGSFLKEVRVSAVNVRYDAATFSLDKGFIWSPRPCKASALAFVKPKSPDFNTRSYLVCFYEDGVGEVLDLACEDAPEITLCGTFSDADYSSKQSSKHLSGMVVAVSGTAYHEILSVCLWSSCGDVSVHRQPGGSSGSVWALKHIADIHDVHDGGTVVSVQFIQNGNGIATCGDNDDRHVRLWTLPETKTA